MGELCPHNPTPRHREGCYLCEAGVPVVKMQCPLCGPMFPGELHQEECPYIGPWEVEMLCEHCGATWLYRHDICPVCRRHYGDAPARCVNGHRLPRGYSVSQAWLMRFLRGAWCSVVHLLPNLYCDENCSCCGLWGRRSASGVD